MATDRSGDRRPPRRGRTPWRRPVRWPGSKSAPLGPSTQRRGTDPTGLPREWLAETPMAGREMSMGSPSPGAVLGGPWGRCEPEPPGVVCGQHAGWSGKVARWRRPRSVTGPEPGRHRLCRGCRPVVTGPAAGRFGIVPEALVVGEVGGYRPGAALRTCRRQSAGDTSPAWTPPQSHARRPLRGLPWPGRSMRWCRRARPPAGVDKGERTLGRRRAGEAAEVGPDGYDRSDPAEVGRQGQRKVGTASGVGPVIRRRDRPVARERGLWGGPRLTAAVPKPVVPPFTKKVPRGTRLPAERGIRR